MNRSGGLALALQEAFTVVCRIRGNRQVAADAGQFRTHIKGLLGRADEEARGMGYDPSDVKLAIYALVALVDESVLRSPQGIFRDWAGRPLQEEIFGDHMAGETFFHNLAELMRRPDSEALVDLLEVHQLCLLLGFRGRYADPNDATVSATMSSVQSRIDRVRGRPSGFTDEWRIPSETIEVAGDPWVRRLAVLAGIFLVGAVGLWLAYQALLATRGGSLAALG